MAPSLSRFLLLLAPQLLAAVALPRQAHHFQIRAEDTYAGKADAVKDAFNFAWNGYYTYAFPHDELHPVSNGFGDSRNGWGASAVDALSTALIMKDKEVVDQILAFIPTIDFTTTSDVVSLFETTIRYLGGMLSAYDLLTGPLSDLASDTSQVVALLAQSKTLADTLKYAFDTQSGVPYNNLWLDDMSNDGAQTNGLATVGTLVLEWTRLSDLLGDDEYAQLAQKAESYLLNPQPAYNEPWPGLVGTNIAIDDGSFTDASGGWNGGDDSFYEYLIKMYMYDPERFGEYKDRWILAVDSSIEHLASHPSSRPDLTYLAAFDGQSTVNLSQHLTCFDGGNFILGGNVLGRQDYIDFGLELVAGCRNTYTSTATGIGPETFSWNESNVPDDQLSFYNEHGFWIVTSSYDLRPEVLESYYYAFRQTRDPRYREWAWEAIVNINATARRGSGFSAVEDVNVAGGGTANDNQESFLFAEVMKYAYMIFADEAEWQVFGGPGGKNQWVFNTEAHPMKVAGQLVVRTKYDLPDTCVCVYVMTRERGTLSTSPSAVIQGTPSTSTPPSAGSGSPEGQASSDAQPSYATPSAVPDDL
ncbi:glycoside hydrolase family 47 protein [Diplodia corticola]|uniref:alpha-1,2-Mannosidase n=1 Tax=Diplodia corticola TaxID=236234 RepID=A0A1J9RHN8_9PEZI|nr:glycoside hydrolase family 47 protein [Diplodia corticola]OJD32067.1 glycoside hydrolase family 47 protein [Diplodia corticola]